ncbi:MAG: hypothetical protein K8L99_28175 [Anaerolineae bacterium]|nr:hypothetical protein [Anaerolineae bacterium]
MVTFDSLNAHFEYMDVNRHWDPRSEPYAGGDALITRLNQGWHIRDVVFEEEYWHAGARLVIVYHFELEFEGEVETMPVLSNPYVRRIVSELPLEVLPITERNRKAVRFTS